MEDMIKIIGGFMSALILLFAKELLVPRLKSKQKARDGVNAEAEIIRTLVQIRDTWDSCKGITLRMNNGGKMHDPSSVKCSSILHETPDNDPPTKEEWQAEPVDANYILMMDQVLKKGFMVLHTDKMEPGKLKDRYASQGYVTSIVFLIDGDRDQELLYATFKFKTPPKVGPVIRDQIRVFAKKLKTLYRV